MKRHILLDGVSATGSGAAVDLGRVNREQAVLPEGLVQATISGTATAALEGSLDGQNWVEIARFSENAGSAFLLMRHLRGNVTAYTTGAVTLTVEV